MEKETFVFRKSWAKMLKSVPDEMRLKFYDAIVDFALFDTEPTLDAVAMMAFTLIRDGLEKDNQRYTEACQKKREAMKKRWSDAGKKKKKSTIDNYSDVQNTIDNYRVNSDYDNDNDSVNDSEYKVSNDTMDTKLIIESTNVASMSADTSDADAPAPDVTQKAFKEKQDKENTVCEQVRTFYNNTILQKYSQLPQCKTKLKDRRRASLLARIKDYGIDAVYTVITKACESDFLGGAGKQGFRASFDWIMRPNNFTKIYEGQYDNRTQQQTAYAGGRGVAQQQLTGDAKVAAAMLSVLND